MRTAPARKREAESAPETAKAPTNPNFFPGKENFEPRGNHAVLKQHHSIAAVLSAALLLSAPLSPFAAAQETRLHHAAQHSPERVPGDDTRPPNQRPGRRRRHPPFTGRWTATPTSPTKPAAKSSASCWNPAPTSSPKTTAEPPPCTLPPAAGLPAEEQILSRVYEMRHAGEKPDINITDTRGNTPLHWAMDHHFPPADHRAPLAGGAHPPLVGRRPQRPQPPRHLPHAHGGAPKRRNHRQHVKPGRRPQH